MRLIRQRRKSEIKNVKNWPMFGELKSTFNYLAVNVVAESRSGGDNVDSYLIG